MLYKRVHVCMDELHVIEF